MLHPLKDNFWHSIIRRLFVYLTMYNFSFDVSWDNADEQ